MSAIDNVKKAMRNSCSTGSLNRGRCCCHPRAWGMKKGLRRARRRVGKDIIRKDLKEMYV